MRLRGVRCRFHNVDCVHPIDAKGRCVEVAEADALTETAVVDAAVDVRGTRVSLWLTVRPDLAPPALPPPLCVPLAPPLPCCAPTPPPPPPPPRRLSTPANARRAPSAAATLARSPSPPRASPASLRTEETGEAPAAAARPLDLFDDTECAAAALGDRATLAQAALDAQLRCGPALPSSSRSRFSPSTPPPSAAAVVVASDGFASTWTSSMVAAAAAVAAGRGASR